MRTALTSGTMLKHRNLRFITSGSINKICKYFKNKVIVLTHEERSSMVATTYKFATTGCLQTYELAVISMDGNKPHEYRIIFHFKDGTRHQVNIPCSALIHGVGTIKWNCSPECFLSIKCT